MLEIENDYMRKEAQINKDVQVRTQDREMENISRLQEYQLEEKQEIFLTHLPDSLMTSLNAEMQEEDRKNMEELKEQLMKQNAEKVAEIEAQ